MVPQWPYHSIIYRLRHTNVDFQWTSGHLTSVVNVMAAGRLEKYVHSAATVGECVPNWLSVMQEGNCKVVHRNHSENRG